MGAYELVGRGIWQDNGFWLKISNKKGGKRYGRVPPFLLLKILFSRVLLRGLRHLSFNKLPVDNLLSDDFSVSTKSIKASDGIVLDKINGAATCMTHQLDATIG